MLLTSRKTNFLNLRYILLLTLRLLSHAVEGKFRVIGSSDPVLAVEGEDAVLPCFVEPKDNVVELPLEWAIVDSHPQDLSEKVDYVHVYRDGQELLDMKAPSYHGRTTLSLEGLRRGDISLRISNVTQIDSGRYRCHLPTMKSFTLVHLLVTPETLLHPNNIQPNETSATGASCRQSSIGLWILCIAVAVHMLI
ncbi:butyrophilin subfamily 3 member A1-like [Takifugu rubripes]|uniref:butyrophilin subfamily 3 member A1-like n=1 Tax=Takifugu rubripes TaxID=31033 RepID=UPI0011458723|nr:butyrophilin subfamily 3 member A1-like [Takifugu rubripes]